MTAVTGAFPAVGLGMDAPREPNAILRLRYQGCADDWAMGIYKATTGHYRKRAPGSFGGATERGTRDYETFILHAGPRTRN